MLAVVREMQHGFFSFFLGGKREGEAGNDKTQGESVPKSPGKRADETRPRAVGWP